MKCLPITKWICLVKPRCWFAVKTEAVVRLHGMLRRLAATRRDATGQDGRSAWSQPCRGRAVGDVSAPPAVVAVGPTGRPGATRGAEIQIVGRRRRRELSRSRWTTMTATTTTAMKTGDIWTHWINYDGTATTGVLYRPHTQSRPHATVGRPSLHTMSLPSKINRRCVRTALQTVQSAMRIPAKSRNYNRIRFRVSDGYFSGKCPK